MLNMAVIVADRFNKNEVVLRKIDSTRLVGRIHCLNLYV